MPLSAFLALSFPKLVRVNLPSVAGIFLVSDDGDAFFAHRTGVARIERRTGRTIGVEVLRIADFGGLPPRLVSRTTSQGLNATVGSLPSSSEPFLYAAARDRDHLVVATHSAITEFDFRDRRKNPNRNWSFDVYGRVIGLSYGPKQTLVAWTWTREVGDGVRFVRYEGRLAHPETGMRQTAALRGRFPRGYALRTLPSVGGFDSLTKTYLLGMAWGGERPIQRVDLSGKVRREIPHRDTTESAVPDAAIEWALRGPSIGLPGGLPAWEPCAYSANRKYWLLRRRADGRAFLFRR